MPFYQFKCDQCKKETILRHRVNPVCEKCKIIMCRDYHGECAGGPPPFQAYYTSTLVDGDVYVKTKAQETALCKSIGMTRVK